MDLFLREETLSAAQQAIILATLSGMPDTTDRCIIAHEGDDLAAKYAQACALTPGSAPVSHLNRVTLVVLPGTYTLAADLELDTEGADVVGLGSIKSNRGCHCSVLIAGATMAITAAHVRVHGISVGTQAFIVDPATAPVVENCSGGNGSFGSGAGNHNGIYVNCTAGDTSFGGSGTASGTYVDCTAGTFSFGGGDSAAASGTFVNCSGSDYSFAGDGGTASGTFTNCSGGEGSFGSIGEASGTFTDCAGGAESFGSGGTMSGTMIRCRESRNATTDFLTWAGGTLTGRIIECNLMLDYATGKYPSSVTALFERCRIQLDNLASLAPIFDLTVDEDEAAVSVARFDACVFYGATSIATMESTTGMNLHYCTHVAPAGHKGSEAEGIAHAADMFTSGASAS